MRHRITINSNGKVAISSNISMADFEVAELFEVSQRELRVAIKAILKNQIRCIDNSGGTIERGFIYPSRYNLDMVVSLSFYLNSKKAQIFRDEIIRRSKVKRHDLFIFSKSNNSLN